MNDATQLDFLCCFLDVLLSFYDWEGSFYCLFLRGRVGGAREGLSLFVSDPPFDSHGSQFTVQAGNEIIYNRIEREWRILKCNAVCGYRL